jgi:hypothetical protein
MIARIHKKWDEGVHTKDEFDWLGVVPKAAADKGIDGTDLGGGGKDLFELGAICELYTDASLHMGEMTKYGEEETSACRSDESERRTHLWPAIPLRLCICLTDCTELERGIGESLCACC